MKYLRGTFRPRSSKITSGCVIRRILLCFVTLCVMAALALFSSLFVVFNSDCKPLKKEVIEKSEKSEITRWIPSLYLSDEEITVLKGEKK